MDDEENRNLFTHAFVEEFVKKWNKLIKEGKPKAVILKGRSDVFCGGGDKETLFALCTGEVTVDDLLLSELVLGAPFPVIAAMEGHAMGGGLLIGACCDMVVAAEESRYGAVFMNMGFTPGMGCTTLLPELMGTYIAAEMMYTGKRFKGSELKKASTNLNYILPKSCVIGKAEEMASRIIEKPRESLYLLKHTLGTGKKKKYLDARLQEDLMHKLSFGFEETRKIIEEFYAG